MVGLDEELGRIREGTVLRKPCRLSVTVRADNRQVADALIEGRATARVSGSAGKSRSSWSRVKVEARWLEVGHPVIQRRKAFEGPTVRILAPLPNSAQSFSRKTAAVCRKSMRENGGGRPWTVYSSGYACQDEGHCARPRGLGRHNLQGSARPSRHQQSYPRAHSSQGQRARLSAQPYRPQPSDRALVANRPHCP